MQNTFSQSGNDSKWFLTKSIFQNTYVALETPPRPPPLHGKCHLKFPFWLFEPLPKSFSMVFFFATKSFLLPILRLTFLESSCNFRGLAQTEFLELFSRLDGTSGPRDVQVCFEAIQSPGRMYAWNINPEETITFIHLSQPYNKRKQCYSMMH